MIRLPLIVALVLAAPALAQTVPTPIPNVTTENGTPRSVTPVFPLNVGVVVSDCSGTITAANTSQQAAATNLRRQILIVQNPTDATERLLVNFGAPATTAAGAVELAAGGSVMVSGPPTPTSAINIAAATAGRRFICKQG